MAKKSKKNNKSAIIIFVLSILVIAGFLLIFSNPSFWFKKSIHEDAKRYSTKHCLVFYPNNDEAKEYAKEMAKGVKNDIVYDYSLVPYGDYYLVSYGNGIEYFVDKEYNSISIDEISEKGQRIIGDYLRYTMKKQNPESYYDAEFIASTTIDKIDFSNVTYEIKGENLKCYFPQYELDVLVPLKYMQTEIGMNFNYPNETYIKPVYIDPNPEHPVMCLTFDDGPAFWFEPENNCSSRIVDVLYKYDANATFYTVGYALESEDEWTEYQKYSFLSRSINNGNEYGSHTGGHDDLVNDVSSADSIKKVIQEPADYLKELCDYEVTTYRPPGGTFDETTLAAQQYPAILWNTDSGDWDTRNPETIINQVLKYDYYDGDIVLFHDIYDETADAVEKIVPELINRGYQLVTVKDMLDYVGINVETLSYYYNFNPSPYYE